MDLQFGGSSSNAPTFTVTKAAAPAAVYAGSSTPISYTLTAQNTGGGSGTLTIGDTVPSGTTLVSGSNACPTVTPPTTCSTSVAGDIVRWRSRACLPEVRWPSRSRSPRTRGCVRNHLEHWLLERTGLYVGRRVPNQYDVDERRRAPDRDPGHAAPYHGVVHHVDVRQRFADGDVDVDAVRCGPLQTPPTCTSTVTATEAVGTYAPRIRVWRLGPGIHHHVRSGHSRGRRNPADGHGIERLVPPRRHTARHLGDVLGLPEWRDRIVTRRSPPTCSTTAASSSTSGTYPSTCSGAVDANYTITYVPGTVGVYRVRLIGCDHAFCDDTGLDPQRRDFAAGGPRRSPDTQIAFAGALLSEEWLVGMAGLLLGSGLVALARWRRRARAAAK